MLLSQKLTKQRRKVKRAYTILSRVLKVLKKMDKDGYVVALIILVAISAYIERKIIESPWEWRGKFKSITPYLYGMSKRLEGVLRKYKPHREIKELTFSETDLTIGKFLPRKFEYTQGILPENQRKNWRRWLTKLPLHQQLMAYGAETFNYDSEGSTLFMPAHLVQKLKNYLDKAAKQ